MCSRVRGKSMPIVVLAIILLFTLPISAQATEPSLWTELFTRILQDWGLPWTDETVPVLDLETNEAEEGPHVDPHGNNSKIGSEYVETPSTVDG